MSDKIKVVIRVRPLIQREENSQMQINWIAENDTIKSIEANKPSLATVYQFDKVFDSSCSNRHVYMEAVQPIVKASMLGFNGTVFAYGQTSSGKTYTIMGCDEQWGVIPYSVAEIFDTIENTPNREFLLRVSYVEIYNETVTDLLSGQTRLKVKENTDGEVYVADLKEEIVRTPGSIFELLEDGEAKRRYGETNMNDRSSRSHTIFRIIIESREINAEENDNNEIKSNNDGIVVVSHLNIVDLAGSERTGQMGATGIRFKEGCAINTSLSTLSNVVSQLSKASNLSTSGSNGQAPFINFRDSILTRILQNSLGGNSKTAIICTVTPAAVEETKSTLQFASRAKIINNKPIKNEVVSDQTMLRRCQNQINQLKQQIHDLTHATSLHALQQEKDLLTKQLTEKEDKIAQLMRLICISSKIPTTPMKNDFKTTARQRRITWCPGARSLNRSMPVFSPVRFEQPDSLYDNSAFAASSSFVSVDKSALLKELQNEENEKVNDMEIDSLDDLPKFKHGGERFGGRRVKFLTPVYEIAENRDIACQTEDLEKKRFSSLVSKSNDSIVSSSLVLVSKTMDNTDSGCQTEAETDSSDKLPDAEEAHQFANLCETLMSEKQELESALKSSKKQLEETRRDCEFVSKVYQDTQNMYDDLKRNYDRMIQNNNLNTTVEFAQLELTVYETSTVNLKSEIDALKESDSILRKQIGNLTKERDEANKQCEELFLEVWQANKKTANVEKEMTRKEVVIENYSTELENLKTLLQQQCDMNNKKDSGVDVEIQTEQRDVVENKSNDDEEIKNGLIDDLQKEIAGLKREVDEFKEKTLRVVEFTDNEVQTDVEFTDNEAQTKFEFTDNEVQTEVEFTDNKMQTEVEFFDNEVQTKVEFTDNEVQTDVEEDVDLVWREKLTKAHQEVARKNSLINDLMNEIDELKRAPIACEETVLNKSCSNVESQTDITWKQFDDEIREARNSLTQLQILLDAAREENRKQYLEMENLRVGMNDLNEVSREQLSHAELVVAEKNEEIAKLNAALLEIQNRLRTVNESAQDAEINRVEACCRLYEIEQENVAINERASEAERRCELLAADLAALEPCRNKIFSQDVEIERYKNTIQSLTKRCDEIRDAADKERQRFNEVAANYEQKLATMQSQSENLPNEKVLRTEIEELQSKNDILLNELLHAKTTVADTKERFDLANNEIERLNVLVETVRKEYSQVCFRANEKEEQFREMLNNYEKQHVDLINTTEKEQIDCLTKENTKLRALSDKYFEELHQAKMRVAQLDGKLVLADEPWRKMVGKKDREINIYKEEIRNLKSDLRKLQEQQENLAETSASLQQTAQAKPVLTSWASSGGGIMENHRVYELENKNYRLSKTVNQLQSELFETKGELEKTRTKIFQLENEKRAEKSSASSLSVSNGSNSRAMNKSPNRIASPKKLSKIASETPQSLRSKHGTAKNSDCKQQ